MSYAELKGQPVRFLQPVAFSARDEFEQTAGALVGKVAPVGGTWAGSGDAVDFAVDATNDVAARTELSDVVGAGRTAVVPVALTNVAVQGDFLWSASTATTAIRSGVIARCAVGGATFARCFFQPISSDTARFQLEIASFIVGTVTIPLPAATFLGTTWYRVQLIVYANGRFFGWFGPRVGMPLEPQLTGYHVDLATGGTTATGGVGIYDEYGTGSPAITRWYDNLLAYVPDKDAAMFASQSLELRHDRATRENAAGTFSGRLAVDGKHVKVPPAGREARSSRFVVKGYRNDPTLMADPAIDDISAQLFVTPRGIMVPE